MWTRERPIIDNKTTIFKNNKAFYGKDIASYPGKVQLLFISNNDYVNPYNKSSNATINKSTE